MNSLRYLLFKYVMLFAFEFTSKIPIRVILSQIDYSIIVMAKKITFGDITQFSFQFYLKPDFMKLIFF